MVEPLVLEARAESVASLSIAGVDSRYYARRLEALAAAAEEGEGAEQQDDDSVACSLNTTQTPAESWKTVNDENSTGGKEADSSQLNLRDQSTKPIEDENEPICMGDHVFKWCSYLGIPYAYQHHAIVMEVFDVGDAPGVKQQRLKVADFSNWKPEDRKGGLESSLSSSTSGLGQSFLLSSSRRNNNHDEENSEDSSKPFKGCIQTYETDAKGWHKVQYRVGFWKKHLSWSGTCTQTASDPPGMVRARVQFLVDNPHLIPPYDAIQSNCECVALWCKTGTWSTLQAASWLSTAAVGQIKSAATLAGAATTAQVTVPAAGVWGWLGYTTQVSLVSTQPIILPAIAAFGVITVGVPAVSLALARRHWNKMTTKLNTAFWEAAVEHPDLFVECITHWSTQNESTCS
ncbi:hypothetical protein ACA910_019919 [Epithemia clementina (nom. ined.)]